MQKKILILHTSVGLGHKVMAENIALRLKAMGDDVMLKDIGEVQKGRFQRAVVAIHSFINRRLPFVWAFLYKFGHYPILPFRVFIAGFNCQSALRLVNQYRPDLIIATQTSASAVVAYLKQKGLYGGLFGIAFSDFHLHPYWLYSQAEFYLANTAEQKRQMVKRGIAAEKIFVCGMNLPQKPEADTNQIRQKFSIKPDEKVALVASGSLGLGVKHGLLQAMSQLPKTKVIAVCGKNSQLFNELRGLFSENSSVIVLGFYKPMAELYAIADVFLSKPGGLSTAEALQFHLPLLVTHMLPGQEKLNYEYLLAKNLVMPQPANAALAAAKELEAGNFRKSLYNNKNVNQLLQGEAGCEEAVSKMLHKFD